MYLVDSSCLGYDTMLTYEELLSLLPSSSVVTYTLKKKETSPSETSVTVYRLTWPHVRIIKTLSTPLCETQSWRIQKLQYLVTYLAAGLSIGVNARHSRYVTTVKVGFWYRVENWVVYSGPPRHLAQVLSLVLPAQLRLSAIYRLSLLQPVSYNYMS